MASRLSIALACLLACISASLAQEPKIDTSRGDKMLAEYFALETKKLQDDCLAKIETLDDWNAKKGEYRRQLLEMLGLDPQPEKTDLKPVITGKTEHDEFVVENLHFQSRPGLYVTGNLYLPRKIEKPLPAILYVCGHGQVKKDGIAYGAKANYQHHGAWFARNGYVCLTIDTLQLGEIEGIHHGTHRYGMWWWLNRGYTPAGVEAWNCVRALDYLESRPEVDKERFGVTGRSGGGAYSWWIAAIDDRIQCAVPVAGITDLQNHVVDGCVEGHCDCMFMLNTYRWDYPLVAALVAPRPLLIANTDSDRIFPLDGVYRTFEQVRRIYGLHESAEKGATAKIALNITAGPHKDTQELQTHAFRWFNIHLKGDDSPIDSRAPKFFEPEQLKVFKELPADQKNTEIHETFVAAAPPAEVPADKGEWETMRDEWTKALSEKSFRGWPTRADVIDSSDPFGPFEPRQGPSFDREDIHFDGIDYISQEGVRLRVYSFWKSGLKDPDRIVLNVLDASGWTDFLATVGKTFAPAFRGESLPPHDASRWSEFKGAVEKSQGVISYMCPRGLGGTIWDQSEKKQVQHRRRCYLLGQSLESAQVWDVRQAIFHLQTQLFTNAEPPVSLQGRGATSSIALYASLFEPGIERLELYDLPKTHRDGPYFLNVSRYLDMPQAVAMAAERSEVVLYQDDTSGWEYPQAVAKQLGWDAKQLQIREKPAASE